MSLTDSHVKPAALEWFGDLGYTVENGFKFASGEAVSDRDSFGKGVLVGRLGAGINGLYPTFSSSRTLFTLRDTLLQKLLSGEIQTVPPLYEANTGL
jgi:hypothetical protein